MLLRNLIDGTFGDDLLEGTAGNDTLTGEGGNDTLLGKGGDDWLWGGIGADRYDGGPGRDVVFFLDGTMGAVVNLATGVIGNDGWGYSETITNVENVHGTNQRDRITLGPGDTYVFSYGGADTLVGGKGNNKFMPGSGADRIDGGDGVDEVAYSPDGPDATPDPYDSAGAPTHGLVVNLAAGTLIDGWGAMDRLVSVERVTGTDFADSMTGDGNSNVFAGDPGADTLIGGGGNDTLDGGAAWDRLRGDAGDDVLLGGDGVDRCDGGDGKDVVGFVDGIQGAVVDVGTGAIANDGFGNAETMISIESVAGTNYGDRITFGPAGGKAYGFGGDDSLIGGEGADEFFGGSGADRIIGGLGHDDVDYWLLIAGVDPNELENIDSAGPPMHGIVANLATGSVVDGWGFTDTLSGIEQVSGSKFSDSITGNAASNILVGAGGDDSLVGGAGSDSLLGGAGKDRLDGGTGNDSVIGGSGDDTLSGGAGNDVLTGAGGNDQFVLNSLSGSDTIADFGSGSDKIVISQRAISVGNGDSNLSGAVSLAGPGGFATSAELVVISGNIAGAITAVSAAEQIGRANSAYAGGASVLFVVDNGNSSAVYRFTATDANTLVSSTELTLLATLTTSAQTALADFVFSA